MFGRAGDGMFFLGLLVIKRTIWKPANKPHHSLERSLSFCKKLQLLSVANILIITKCTSNSVSTLPSSFLPSLLLSTILHQPLPGSASSFCQLRLQVRTCRKSGTLSSLSLLFCLHSSFTFRIHEALYDRYRKGVAAARPIVRCQGKSPLIRFRTCVGKRLRQKPLLTTFPADTRSHVEALYFHRREDHRDTTTFRGRPWANWPPGWL